MHKLFFIFFLILVSCNNNNYKKESIHINKQTVLDKKIIDRRTNKQISINIDKDSIWNKPVRFYVENPNCNKTAVAFYFGKFKPEDNSETEKLLELVISDDTNLRPFYRWILYKTIFIQDGALGEYTGIPARKYAEKFPNKFFEYTDWDISGELYSEWCNAILYSGFYSDDDYKKPKVIRQNMIKTMKTNFKNCNDSITKRIEKFALDCFPDFEK
jgi:exonuclease I